MRNKRTELQIECNSHKVCSKEFLNESKLTAWLTGDASIKYIQDILTFNIEHVIHMGRYNITGCNRDYPD